MSKWWLARLVWLGLGLLAGVIGLTPVQSADAVMTINGVLTLVYIAAAGVLLIRWLLPKLGFKRGGDGGSLLKRGLLWDTVFFVGATVLCAYLFHLAA